MAAKLTPAGLILKWVAVPGLLLVFGYYVVGPRFGKSTLPPEPPANAAPPAASSSSPQLGQSGASASSEPEVDITAHKSDDGSQPKRHASKRRHHKPTPKEEGAPEKPVPTSPSTTPDEGGSAGSTTSGQV